MEEKFQELFSLLDTVGTAMARLSGLANEKIEAVKNDDLMAINEVINREQAEALNFRGLESRREKLLKELNISSDALSQLPASCPVSLQEQARECVARLQESCKAYRQTADHARAILEKELREIDGTISALGVRPPVSGPGYRGQTESGLPSKMKTDFRA